VSVSVVPVHSTVSVSVVPVHSTVSVSIVPVHSTVSVSVVPVHSTVTVSVVPVHSKGKERKSIYIAPFCTKVHSKRSGVDHTVLPANNTTPAFPS